MTHRGRTVAGGRLFSCLRSRNAISLLLFAFLALTLPFAWPHTALAQQTDGAKADYESEPDLGGLLAATKNMRMTQVEPGLSLGTATYPPFGLRIHVFDFASDRFALRIAEQKARTGSRAADFFDDKNDVFVINGGYFERKSGRKLSSSGLLIVDGERIAREHERAGSGVIYAGADGVKIVYRKDFREKPGVSHALQVGPILVDPGGVKGIYENVGGRYNRSAICLRNGTFTAFVVEGGISLFQFADLLSLPRSDGGFGCDVAINLDGGPSTQASLRIGAAGLDIVGGSTVHNVLIVSRRPQG
jgi:hypothetical protein